MDIKGVMFIVKPNANNHQSVQEKFVVIHITPPLV